MTTIAEVIRRDARGRFASSSSATTALNGLARGEKVDVAPGDVGAILDAAAGRSDHPDLTELHVNGTPKFGLDGLGYGRADMPVLGSKHLPGFVAHVSGKGVKVTHERVDPQSLKPMQREVSASSAGKLYQGMRDGTLPDKSLVVSADNFVIDGHHRWGAATGLSFERAGLTVPVIRIDMGARALRETALAWNRAEGISTKAIGEAVIDDGHEVIAEHLKGKHNQALHGRGAGPGNVPQYKPKRDTQSLHAGDGMTGYTEGREAFHHAVIESRLDGLPTSNAPTLYMTGGGPASGKTKGLLENPATGIPGPDAAAHFDPDAMKGEMPEYQIANAAGRPWAAAHAHEESSYMAKTGVNTGLSRGHDVVYDSVGDSGHERLAAKVAAFRSKNPGTIVRAEYATCSLNTALARADRRARETGRKVPKKVITESHADVSRTFVTATQAGVFDSARLWDTEGDTPVLVFSYDRATGGTVHNQTLWDAFRAKGG